MQQSFLCPRCNNAAHLGQRFCGFCDLAFLYSCVSCGSALEVNAAFCGHCGTQVDWVEPARPGSPPATGAEEAPATETAHVEMPVDIGQPGAHHHAAPAGEPGHAAAAPPAISPLPPLRDSYEQPAAEGAQAAAGGEAGTSGQEVEGEPAPDNVKPASGVPEEHRARAAKHQERSLALLKDGHYSLAVDELTRALEYDPGTAIIYMLRGSALYRKGDLEGALEDLQKAIGLDPDLPEAYYHRGTVHYYRKEFDQAIADFSRAIAADDSDPAAFHNRGCAHMMKGQFFQAIDDINRAIQLDPRDPRVFCSRGSAYMQIGQNSKAADDYRWVKSMTNDPAVISKAEQALRELGES